MSKAAKSQASTSPPWIALTLLGTLAAAWAIFLWRQLLAARAGLEPFCGFGDGGDCAALWDGAFAADIHRWTGVPVAGWGVVWGLIALALPLLARRNASWTPAVRLVAWSGAAGIAGLLGASLAAGMFCSSCALTYALTLAYAVVAWRGLGAAPVLSGAVPAGGMVIAAFLLVLYPGLKTPKNAQLEGTRVLAEIAKSGGSTSTGGSASTSAAPTTATDDDASSDSASTADDAPREAPKPLPTGRPVAGNLKQARDLGAAHQRDFDKDLRSLLEELTPELRQGVADSIYFYENAPAFPLERPRALRGTAQAPVIFTEFTDTLCSHCATLHENLAYVFGSVPQDAFAFETRQFPLDGLCNPHVERQDEYGPPRCTAAKVKICMEGSGSAFEVAGKLYDNQQDLTVDKIYELVAGFAYRTPLEECVASEETAKKLLDDITFAKLYQLRGTPLLLVNGREAAPFGPFLLAMVYTGGSTEHPILKELLPRPSPNIPIHQLQ